MAVSRTTPWVSGGDPHEVTTEPLNEQETQAHLDIRHNTAVEFWQVVFPPDP